MRHVALWAETSTWTAYLTSIARWTYDSNDRSENQFPHMKLLLGGKSPPPSPAAPLLPPLLLYLPP